MEQNGDFKYFTDQETMRFSFIPVAFFFKLPLFQIQP